MKAPIRISSSFVTIAVVLAFSACGGANKDSTRAGTAADAGSAPTTSAVTGSQANTSTSSSSRAPEQVGQTLPADVVASVGDVQITKATLNQWMTVAGGEVLQFVSLPVSPVGAFTDPPNVSSCGTLIARLASARSKTAHGHPKRSRATICRLLTDAIKREALSQILERTRESKGAASLGVGITNADVAKAFNQFRANGLQTEPQLTRYLRSHGMTLADELQLLRATTLENKVVATVEAKGGSDAFSKFITEEVKRWTDLTTCRTGYVVEGCRGYVQPKAAPPSAISLIDEVLGKGQ